MSILHWSTNNENCIFPGFALGKSFGMGDHRFETILHNLALTIENEGTNKWHPIKRLYVYFTLNRKM